MSGVAFGGPGIPPTWCSSDKDFVTTSLGPARLWATVGHGIVNEVYWPSTGTPQVRDLGFYLVGAGKWIDLKRVRDYALSTPGPALPLLTITHRGEDYRLELEILPDPRRDVLLVRYAIEGPYRLVVLLAPHLGSTGRDNSAWVDGGDGYASRGSSALCLTANPPLEHVSCGYVGASDGWQDLQQHAGLTWSFASAPEGTVALCGEATGASGVVSLGFAESARGARTLARTAFGDGFESLRDEFLQAWREWGAELKLPRPDDVLGDAAILSACVLKMHEDRTYPGAIVASLSVPWGNTTDNLGGYHLVWPRDATLSAFALLAAEQVADATRILGHLMASQSPDGHWPQNYFPSGEAFWTGTQLDETALPVLLAAKLRERGEAALPGAGRMVRAAVAFLARTGPSSEQDRWEEDPGVSPFTLATVIAALVAAGPWLEPDEREAAERLADDWNERLESWCYVRDTDLARDLGVAGYYVRIANADESDNLAERVQLRNREGETILAEALVSMDFSWLVRLGLRNARDPRVLDTLSVVDHVLRVETPSGGLYHRYNQDGYGEHADGRPFDGSGIGRAWPLLSGERGHLALQAGEESLADLRAIWHCASQGGLLPEQVWDAAPIPSLGLLPGRASGSAMPLVWAHAEFLKLLVARERGRPVELLAAVEERYPGAGPRRATALHWRDEVPVRVLEQGRALRIEDRRPFTLQMGFDGWQGIARHEATAQPFGLWAVVLEPAALAGHGALDFTRRYGEAWEGADHHVQLAAPPPVRALAPGD